MIPLTVAEVARATGARMDCVSDPAALVTGPVVVDSRQAGAGALFVALPGERVDGHDYAAAAAAGGAVVTLASRPVGVPALITADVPAALGMLARTVVAALPSLTVAGITGSAGKTTAKDLAAQLIEPLGPTIAPAGSFNNEIGHPLTVLRATAETRYMVLELSARKVGDIAYLCGIAPPQLGVVLCVGTAHAGEFGGVEKIAWAKGELPAALPDDGVALLNADDPLVSAMADRTAARAVLFGRGPGAGVRAVDVALDSQGRPGFTLVTPEGEAPVQLRLFGEHNVTNALAAAALARELGMDVDSLAAGLSAATTRSRWRMEVSTTPGGVTVVNDAYNANPDAVAAALHTLSVMAAGRRAYAVLGHMAELGPDSPRRHEEVGALAARAGVAGLVVVGEEAEPMLAGAQGEPSWHGALVAVPDVAAAVAELRNRLGPGDVVLVKASRSAGLERVAQALTEAVGEGRR
ncbi:MAG TPA: UDP-N-acetylmuramoyl-tripeptide--D-alanyl-D-alanine ligase [Streptosporangiaceae bacterium]|nr:UDP-N-acetylmuramoyl-tripeptide--D-alanyl-D-alanine ligase [Streptosporangiaceae bacterium]